MEMRLSGMEVWRQLCVQQFENSHGATIGRHYTTAHIHTWERGVRGSIQMVFFFAGRIEYFIRS